MQKSIYILVCAFVRMCDDPLESFNVFDLLVPEDAAQGSSCSVGLCQFRLILLPLLRARFGELRKPSNSYKIDVSIFKAQLLRGST